MKCTTFVIICAILLVTFPQESSEHVFDYFWKFLHIAKSLVSPLVNHGRSGGLESIGKHRNEIMMTKLNRGINGGIPCAACTILLSMAEQLSQIHNETTFEALERLCNFLPNNIQHSCHTLMTLAAPIILEELIRKSSPDIICHAINLCKIDEGKPMCHLFPLPKSRIDFGYPSPRLNAIKGYQVNNVGEPWICHLPGIEELCKALGNVYTELEPGIDIDGDRFSPSESLRGSIWRGRDCSDISREIYPGRLPMDSDRYYDSNCNGIYGYNETSGLPLEDELCLGSGSRGVIFIGDSVSAHFHAPPVWFTPAKLTPQSLSNLSYVVSNEADWPDLGFATGFRESPMPMLIDGQVDSIYLRLRKRNLCNHRDYQNLARNGAQSYNTEKYIKSIARDKNKDKPALVFYSLVGNDVCNEFGDTIAHMTPPKTFRFNVIKSLQFLESKLPSESHVVLIGLIDASVIYGAMAHRYHPLGELNKNLRYEDVYKWFNCMEIGPCHGFLTSNETLRQIASKHSRKLTKILKQIATEAKFDSFDVHYVPNPFHKVITDWVKNGGEVWELIEPVDSLHPTQDAQALIAEVLWNRLEKNFPHILGPINPNNQIIQDLFRDQGGH